MKNLTLCLHRGAKEISRSALSKMKAPEGTDTWCPIGFEQLLTTVETQLQTSGFQITDQVHGIGRHNKRYFGLLQVSQKSAPTPDYSWVLGVRNSHDKAFPAAIAAGSRVFVCDNLAFTGEIRFDRRNTKYIERDLPNLVSRAIGTLSTRWNDLGKRIEAYKERQLNDLEAHDLIIQCLDAKAIGIQKVPLVLKEWRKPSHEEFAPRNAWSLFNAVTEIAKHDNIFQVGERTEALHGVMDSACGVLIGTSN